MFSTYCMNNSLQTDQNTHTPVTLTISTGCIQGEIKSLLLGGIKGLAREGSSILGPYIVGCKTGNVSTLHMLGQLTCHFSLLCHVAHCSQRTWL